MLCRSSVHKSNRIAIYLLKSGQVTTLKALSQFLVKDTSTLYRWLKQYKKGGLAKLIAIYKPRGKPSSIPANIIERLKHKLQEPIGFNSYQEIQEWLKNEHQLDLGYFVVYRVVRRLLKAKPKVPRPTSSKQDKAAVQRFRVSQGINDPEL